MKKNAILICLGLLFFQSFAQTSDLDLKEADHELTRLYEALKIADWEIQDSLVTTFKKDLFLTLEKPGSFSYSFDSLSNKLTNVKSQDDKIRIWSWNQHTGGNWQSYISVVQFKTKKGGLEIRQLNSGEEVMLGGYTDVYIYEIFEIKEGNEVYYLTFGHGTHGSGNYHKLAQLFTIRDSEFIKCEFGFEKESDLVLEVWRGDDIELKFDQATNAIYHNVLVHDEMRDRFYITDEIQKWEFADGTFNKGE